jgi:futalosine hydrolase
VRGALSPIADRGPSLLVVAAPVEARAALHALDRDASEGDREWSLITLSERLEMVVSGVGKAAAAGATARFADPVRHAAVISLGVAGALPGSGLEIGDVVLAERAAFADEGFQTPEGFTDIASAGFPPGPEGGMGARSDDAVVDLLRPLADTAGVVATVSTCSGTDALADEIARRTGAIAEAMEGGAVGVTAQRLSRAAGRPLWFSELRVISNTTGDRDRQRWDLRGASRVLGEVVTRL